MAFKVAIANGNWSTAATWDNVSNTPTMHISTNVTLTAAADTDYTPQFTAPVVDATCAATGVALFFATISSVGTITVTLQQNPAAWADVATCTGSINCATIYAALGNSTTVNNWIYFRAATPHVFTVADANYYRWKIVLSGATGNSTVAADANSTTLASFWSTNVIAVPAVPAATDLVMIPGQGDSTVIKVSVDGSRSIGNLTNTAACIAMRPATASLFWDVQIGYGGELNFDNTASATLTCKGCIAVGAGGTYRMDNKAGAAYAAAFVAKMIFDPTTTADCGLGIFDKSTVIMEGQPKSSTTLWRTTPAATWNALDQLNLQTADNVGWAVGDEILVGPTGAYGQTEYMTISNVDAANQYDFSAALVYSHSTSAQLLNITRNVVIETDDAAKGFYIYNANTVDANVSIQWVRFNNVGGGGANKYGIALASISAGAGSFNYCVAYNGQGSSYGYHTYSASIITKTYTGLIACGFPVGAGAASAGFMLYSAKNKTLSYCYCVDLYSSGFYFSTASNNILSYCYAIATNQVNQTNRAGIYLISSPNNKIQNSEIYLNRSVALLLSGATDIEIIDSYIGKKGAVTMANGYDVYCTSDTYNNNVVLTNCTMVDLPAVTNYNAMVTGSEVRIHNYNTTAMKHYAYRATGVYQATGVGLADTTVRTASSYAVGMFPDLFTGGTGLKWTSYVVARAGKTVVVYGYHNRTTANLTVNLYLPGSTTADHTFTDSTTSGWQSWLVSKAYAGTVDALAKVEIIATGTAGSIYIDDWYNGTNALTALDVWEGGKPATIIYPELGDPGAVWEYVLDSGNTAQVDLLRIPTAITDGTCQAGSTTAYAKLALGEPAANDYYNGCLLTITGGTGAGQARLINDWIGATQLAIVNDPFVTAPDITSTYKVQPFSGILLADTGTATGGAASTITLATSASAVANTYVGHTVFLCGGVGIGQARVITAYTAGRVATVYPAWTTQPTNQSIYMILPVSAINAPAIMDVACVGTKTMAECIELIMALCRLAKNTGFPAGPCVVRDIADTTDLATITFDADGNVTNVVIP